MSSSSLPSVLLELLLLLGLIVRILRLGLHRQYHWL
jgi:hypothetical protein